MKTGRTKITENGTSISQQQSLEISDNNAETACRKSDTSPESDHVNGVNAQETPQDQSVAQAQTPTSNISAISPTRRPQTAPKITQNQLNTVNAPVFSVTSLSKQAKLEWRHYARPLDGFVTQDPDRALDHHTQTLATSANSKPSKHKQNAWNQHALPGTPFTVHKSGDANHMHACILVQSPQNASSRRPISAPSLQRRTSNSVIHATRNASADIRNGSVAPGERNATSAPQSNIGNVSVASSKRNGISGVQSNTRSGSSKRNAISAAQTHDAYISASAVTVDAPAAAVTGPPPQTESHSDMISNASSHLASTNIDQHQHPQIVLIDNESGSIDRAKTGQIQNIRLGSDSQSDGVGTSAWDAENGADTGRNKNYAGVDLLSHLQPHHHHHGFESPSDGFENHASEPPLMSFWDSEVNQDAGQHPRQTDKQNKQTDKLVATVSQSAATGSQSAATGSPLPASQQGSSGRASPQFEVFVQKRPSPSPKNSSKIAPLSSDEGSSLDESGVSAHGSDEVSKIPVHGTIEAERSQVSLSRAGSRYSTPGLIHGAGQDRDDSGSETVYEFIRSSQAEFSEYSLKGASLPEQVSEDWEESESRDADSGNLQPDIDAVDALRTVAENQSARPKSAKPRHITAHIPGHQHQQRVSGSESKSRLGRSSGMVVASANIKEFDFGPTSAVDNRVRSSGYVVRDGRIKRFNFPGGTKDVVDSHEDDDDDDDDHSEDNGPSLHEMLKRDNMTLYEAAQQALWAAEDRLRIRQLGKEARVNNDQPEPENADIKTHFGVNRYALGLSSVCVVHMFAGT
jgi:hypothetical protein